MAVRRFGFPFLLLALVAVVPLAAQRSKTPVRKTAAKYPNIILITLDTTRADRMGFLGSDR
jgi:hypothetical protein